MSCAVEKKNAIVDILSLAAVDEDGWTNELDMQLDVLLSQYPMFVPAGFLEETLKEPSTILNLKIGEDNFLLTAIALVGVSENWNPEHDELLSLMLKKLDV